MDLALALTLLALVALPYVQSIRPRDDAFVTYNELAIPDECRDLSSSCRSSASQGLCLLHPYETRTQCPMSCRTAKCNSRARLKNRLKGHATVAGTAEYARRMQSLAEAASGHYRLAYTLISQGDPDIGTALMLSSLGMGTYLGAADVPTDELVVSALLHSLTRGWNVIDTASNYRWGAAEVCVGEALGSLLAGSSIDEFPKQGNNLYGGTSAQGVPDPGDITRDMVFISTKAGFLDEVAARKLIKEGAIQQSDVVTGHCMHPACLRVSLSTSLQRLQLEAVDLLYLHNAAEMQLQHLGLQPFLQRLGEAFAALEAMRKEGQIQFYGLATWNCFRVPPTSDEHLDLQDVVKVAERVGGAEHGFRFIQLPVNPGMAEAWNEDWQQVGLANMTLLEAAKQLHVQVFASGPLMEAELVKKLGMRGAVVEELQDIDGAGAKLLQWARSTPGLLTALVGHKSRGHVANNVPLAKIPPLSEEKHAYAFNRLRSLVA